MKSFLFRNETWNPKMGFDIELNCGLKQKIENRK